MIPLSIPHLAGNEWKYVKDCIDTGWISSAGAYVTQFEQMVADYAGTRYGIAAVNGTLGLHLCMHLHGIGQGDAVLVPNITFIASANAVAYTKADPIFIDVDPNTWQIDLNLLEQFLVEQCEQKTAGCYLKATGQAIKAIMPVHVLGNMCDMERLLNLANEYHLLVVEDSTEALGSYWKGKHAGGFGKMGVFSFNGNKIISTGGGGVIVTDDEALAKRAKHLSTQSKVDPLRYFHDEIGFNYRLVNVLAAIGVAQMEQLNTFIAHKKRIDAHYREQLDGVGDIRFQKVEAAVDANCWLFTFSTSQREELLQYLIQQKIVSRPFWTPMNQLPMFQQNLYITQADYSNQVHADSLSIPSSVNLTEAQQAQVIAHIQAFFEQRPNQ
ncbi:MAG: LegC family aminotransferase [Bacteroidota bacterium]